MPFRKSDRSIIIWIISIIAIVFGLLTIKSGGSVLFIDGTFRKAVGNFVPFVVWFNFLAGFAYFTAGIGLWLKKRWGVWLSIFIVSMTLIIFAIFGFVILNGQQYEVRTIFAMSFRSIVWAIISIFAYRKLIHY